MKYALIWTSKISFINQKNYTLFRILMPFKFQHKELSKLLRRSEEFEITSYNTKEINKQLLDKLINFDTRCFPATSKEDSKYDFIDSDRVYVATNNSGEIIGTLVREPKGRKKAYVTTVCVIESERGKYVYQELLRSCISGAIFDNITTIKGHTQNAKVEYGLRKLLDNLIMENKIDKYTIKRKIKKNYFEDWVHPAGLSDLKSESGELNKIYASLGSADAFLLTVHIQLHSM